MRGKRAKADEEDERHAHHHPGELGKWNGEHQDQRRCCTSSEGCGRGERGLHWPCSGELVEAQFVPSVGREGILGRQLFGYLLGKRWCETAGYIDGSQLSELEVWG